MRRRTSPLPVVPVLALALVLSGCVHQASPAANEPLDDAAAPTPDPTDDAEPEREAPTPPTAPTEPTSTAPEPPGNATNGTAAPAPAAPPATPDFHAEEEGWVAPPAPEPFTTRLAIPVQAGARNVTVRVDLSSTYPAEVPRQTANVTVRLLGADGKVLAEATRTALDEGASVVLDVVGPLAVGEHQGVATILGASAGESVGDRYRLVVHVAY